MSSQRLLALALVMCFTGTMSLQAQGRPKFSAAQVAEAETKLKQANCGLHNEILPPLTPDGPPQKGPVEIVAFPVDVTDAELAKLMPLVLRLPGVTTVGLSNCAKITVRGFKEVVKLNDMKALFVDGTMIDKDGLKELKALKQLHWLDLSRTSIGDNDILTLDDIGVIHHLTLDTCNNLTTEGFANLAKLQRMRSLQTTIYNDQAKMMTEIAKLKGLLELTIQPVSDSEARKIADLERLQLLDINADVEVWANALRGRDRGNKAVKPAMGRPAVGGNGRAFTVHSVSAVGFASILKCLDLRTLRVAGHPLDVKGSGLDKLERLQELDLSGTNITDDGISYLGKLRALKKLALSGTAVTNSGVRELSACGSLESVALDYLPITDEAIRYLAQNRKLKELHLNNTRVSCTEKSAWMLFPRLEKIELRATNVTDSSILTLAQFKTLKYADLMLNCPNVTYDGLQKLRQELPRTTILGFACDATYWVGGGGIPFVKKPDLGYKAPDARPGNTQTNPPPVAVQPKAPPPPVRIAPIGTGPKN